MTSTNPKKYTILWSETFKSDLTTIYNYLFYTLKAQKAARKLHQKVVTSLNSLKIFPTRHLKINHTKLQNLHRILIDNFIIIYTINYKLRNNLYSPHLP